MKSFTVGLPVRRKPGFIEKIIANKEYISEVYFSYGEFASGRSHSTDFDLFHQSTHRQKEDLDALHSAGLKFNLLFNGNCFGAESLSYSLFNRIGMTVEGLKESYKVTSVTTTSPVIARFIKENFHDIKTRASVNMEIGTTEGFDYLSDVFDGYYLKREFNRDLKRIKTARNWCDAHGKELFCLANSGCLNFCSAHTFHDNLVAHEAEIGKMDNAYGFDGICHKYLKRDGSISEYLRVTSFIRPEDIPLISEYFDGIKLATRSNSDPSGILDAYIKGSYNGAVTSLLEPDHSGLFYPKLIDNRRIDPRFTKTVLFCPKQCDSCGYCKDVTNKSIIDLEDI